MARLTRNSIWKIRNGNGDLDIALYRLLEIYPDHDLVVMFQLDNVKRMKRPLKLSIKRLKTEISDGLMLQEQFDVPHALQLGEEEIPEEWKQIRDRKYKLIAPLVQDQEFLLRLVSTGKSSELRKRAEETACQLSTLYRTLHTYWRYGQTKNALIPLYANSGAPGKPKPDTGKQRGRPPKQPVFDFQTRENISISEIDKKQIRAAINEYYINQKAETISSVYKKFLFKYHLEEIEQAEHEKRAPVVPSITQFRYWFKILRNIVKDEKRRDGEVAWEKNKRGLLGSVSENVSAPGDRYEIDATVGDIYLVSPYNRTRVLGRPVIYVIVDEASRAVVGFFVDIAYASWDSAKQALLNSFLPKTAFCERFGVSITEDDWPCHHLPRALLADRGEMIGLAPEQHLSPMGLKLEFAAATRADWKSVVERRFGIVNKEALHELQGTTKGKPRGRMDPDPKKKAIHTIREVTAILIKDFIEFNKTRHIDDLRTPGLISLDLAPTPLNFWNYHVSRHLDSLSTVDEMQARAELLPAIKVQVTGRGITDGQTFYTCPQAEKEEWFSRARMQGEWSLDARVDDENTSIIYVRKDIRSPLVPCTILPREKLYADRHRAEVIWLSEWTREKKETNSDLAGKVRQAGNVDNSRKQAMEDRKKEYGTFSETPNKTKNLKDAREKENEQRLAEKQKESEKLTESEPGLADQSTLSKLSLIERVLGNEDG
jgi:putative transposase